MINILLCGNDKIFDGVLTTLISIMHHCKDSLKVHIFTMDVSHLKPDYTCISDDKIEFINKMLKDTNPDSQAIKFDVTEFYKTDLAGSPNEDSDYSPYCLIRLFIDKFEEMPDKLLYLDVDLLLNSNIRKLYDIDISKYEYAGAKDYYGHIFIKPDYINSGVLLFNVKKIRETNLFEKARKVVMSKKMLLPDQSAIYESTTSKLIIPQKFNSQRYLKSDTVIRHFSKRIRTVPYPKFVNVKPWQVSNMHKIYKCYHFDDILYTYIYYKKLYENTLRRI